VVGNTLTWLSYLGGVFLQELFGVQTDRHYLMFKQF